MVTKKIELEFPEEMIRYVKPSDKDAEVRRNAMLMYPFVHDGTISHGKAAAILGMKKMDLICLYGSMGFPFFNETPEELQDDLNDIKALRKQILC